MGILVDDVRRAFERFKENKDEFELGKTMVHIGDYSIRSQYNAGVVYSEIARLKALNKLRH